MRKKTKKTREIIQDQELLKKISPVGRISHHETYTRTGTGYEACIHIWDFPAGLNDYWLTKACNQPNTITTINNVGMPFIVIPFKLPLNHLIAPGTSY